MTILPPVLHEAHLPLAERMAARLDGELFGLGDGHCAIDEIERPVLRALGVLGARPRRLIGELGTAAWIWGALPLVPTHLEFCVDLQARARPAPTPLSTVREVVLLASDVVDLGDARVMSPIRTAVDLARSRERFGPDDAATVRALAVVAGFGLADCVELMDRRRNLPAKRRAVERLRAALG